MGEIAVNGRFLTQGMTGVQRFATEIVRALGTVAPGEVIVYTPPDARSMELEGVRFKQVGTRSGQLWEQIDLPLALRAHGRPPLVSLTNAGPLFYRPHFYTLHDVTFRRFPKGFSRSFRYAYNVLVPLHLWRAEGLFTVSSFSALEISREFGIPAHRFAVISNAVAPTFCRDAVSLDSVPEGPYFLTIGSVGSNKDFTTLLAGHALYRKRGGGAGLVVVGPTPGGTEVTPEGVNFVERIRDEELRGLYQNATAYVSASLYEGFGIPLIEAQACGIPVIASRIAVHEEVLGHAAYFFSPRSTYELAEGFLWAESGDLRDLTEGGRLNAARFSWEASAERLVARVRGLDPMVDQIGEQEAR